MPEAVDKWSLEEVQPVPGKKEEIRGKINFKGDAQLILKLHLKCEINIPLHVHCNKLA